MSETRFSDIGKIEAITRLYEGTPFKPFSSCYYEAAARDAVTNASKILLEGIDFNLIYFPLKHLGYKSVVSVTGELYSEMVHPVTLSVVLGVSAKLDFEDIKELWGGIVAAAKEHGYRQVELDLVPSRNGLTISVSAMGKDDDVVYPKSRGTPLCKTSRSQEQGPHMRIRKSGSRISGHARARKRAQEL